MTAVDQDDEQAAESTSSLLWPITSLVLVLGVIAYLTVFDFLIIGDGSVGVDSEAVPVAIDQPSPSEVGTAYVGYAKGGVFTIGFPLRNSGFLPVTVDEIEPVEEAEIVTTDPSTSDPSCIWQRTAVRGTREGISVPGAGPQEFGSASVAGGANVQLYIEGTFPDASCPTEAGGYSTRDSMVVSYKVLGLVPRRQVIPLAIKVTTAYDPKDPNLPPAED
jgi:hypothetical protein